jgi:pimeloyl-ACP methyl ester carboxylesterase/quercetin dioxygenase-like cupin family protein
MSLLDVPGARLYYETCGSGPLLLIIPGSNGEADAFKPVAEQLAAHYTVVTYDRRGFSRSRLDGPQDHDHRLTTDAEDVHRLIEHLSEDPATVVGFSSGGLVALEVLTHHPSAVRTLVPFEPPAMRQLADGQKWLDFFSSLYDLHHQSGMEPALKKFGEQTFAESDRQVMAARARNAKDREYVRANAAYWFEHELRQYPAVELDLDVLKTRADRIVLMVGEDSRGHPACEVNVELGKKLGRDVIELPGGHLGCVARPVEFAREFVRALTASRTSDQRSRAEGPPAGRNPDQTLDAGSSHTKEEPLPHAGAPIVWQPGAGPTIEGPVGGPLTFKLRGEQSNGKLAVLENVLPPGEGPPVHTHANEDEAWYVLEGELRFIADAEESKLPAGSFVFVPSGTTYTFQNVGVQPARILVILTPAGLEPFFERVAEIPGDTDILAAYRNIGRGFGVDVVGPPLAGPRT